MTRNGVGFILIAVLLVILSWQKLLAIGDGLVQKTLELDGTPALFLAPQNAQHIPGVLVGHGFAGSKQLMLGYGYVLARAGYAVLLWDFAGHGANANPMSTTPSQSDVDIAYAGLIDQPAVDHDRIAIIGHSRGSGAAMAAAVQTPDRYDAVVAISPVQATVSPMLPANLMLQAGSLETSYIANARQLLADAGGSNADLAAGRGRVLEIIPNAEHITILFRPLSHHLVLSWLDETFGHESRAFITDRRVIWYGVHLLGWMILLAVVAPLAWKRASLTSAQAFPEHHRWQSWLGILLGPVGALGVLGGLEQSIDVASLGGVLVGGAVSLWFFVAGTIWLLVAGGLRRVWMGRPRQDLLMGAGLFLWLTLAFGMMAQWIWVQWWLIPARLAIWPLLVLGMLPWFLAVSLTQRLLGVRMRVVWWLVKSAVVIGGLLATLSVVPGLSILTLMVPLVPILFGLLDFANVYVRSSWSYALGSALFFGWALAAVFPLAG
jgi:pimeloyl-ACP methyl ester carboxylesterase